jgi:hypothetical protein
MATEIKDYKASASQCHCWLQSLREAEAARRYLAGLGITEDLVETFNLGYLPTDCKGIGIDPDLSRLSGRLILPVCNAANEIVGFAGRALVSSHQVAKYLFTADTPSFRRGELLYGIECLDPGSEMDLLYCESAFDVLACYSVGVPNAVSSMGCAVSGGIIRQLARFTHRVTIAFDGDDAGTIGAIRAVGEFLRYGFDVRILKVPNGLTLADLVARTGTDGFRRELENTVSPGTFVAFCKQSAPDLIDSVFALAAKCSSQPTREQVIVDAAHLLGLDPTELLIRFQRIYCDNATNVKTVTSNVYIGQPLVSEDDKFVERKCLMCGHDESRWERVGMANDGRMLPLKRIPCPHCGFDMMLVTQMKEAVGDAKIKFEVSDVRDFVRSAEERKPPADVPDGFRSAWKQMTTIRSGRLKIWLSESFVALAEYVASPYATEVKIVWPNRGASVRVGPTCYSSAVDWSCAFKRGMETRRAVREAVKLVGDCWRNVQKVEIPADGTMRIGEYCQCGRDVYVRYVDDPWRVTSTNSKFVDVFAGA